MSYILEALKKSEQERRIGAVPDLSAVQEPPTRASPRWPRWLLAALSINAVILIVLAWRIWGDRHSAEQAAATGVVTPAQPVIAQLPTPAEGATGTRVDMSLIGDEQQAIVNAPSSLPAPVAEDVGDDRLPAESLQGVPPTSESVALGPDLAPVPDFHARDNAATATVNWEHLPTAEAAGLPIPRVDVHVFASEPERRFVLVDLRKYLEGDTLENGTVIETILADGMILSYQGQRYRVDRP